MGQFVDVSFPVSLIQAADIDGQIIMPTVDIKSTPAAKKEQRIQTAAEGRYQVRFVDGENRWWDAEAKLVYEFYCQVGGKLNSFRLRDPRPYWNSATNQLIGAGDGATVAFQLVRSFGGYVHAITKPVASGVAIYIDGLQQTTRWAVSLTSGVVTFSADVVRTVTNAASSGTDTVLTFASNSLQVGDSVWLSGFTGPWAGLNAARYLITARTSTTVTFAFDSSGYAAYSANGGSTNTIPQGAEQITADITHDWQVRFAQDVTGAHTVLNQLVSLHGLKFVEVDE